MNQATQQTHELPVGRRILVMAGLVAGIVTLALALIYGSGFFGWDGLPNRLPFRPNPDAKKPQKPVMLARGKNLTVWWDELPGAIRARAKTADDTSNIHPADYTGPVVCQQCHPKNYETWSLHPHRWMNALATAATVRGDFSASSTIAYRGGKASFEQQDDVYRMRLERDSVTRVYRVTQTIGSRFYQYYVGRLIAGPEPPAHHFYHKDHVLPFGWWLDQKQWVPIVHIGPEVADEDRPDPFAPPESGVYYAEYAVSCNYCHSTFPLADLAGRIPHQMGEHAPLPLHWSVRPYMAQAHPQELQSMSPAPRAFSSRALSSQALSSRAGETLQSPMADWDAQHYAATFGVSCEACHLGARAHVESRGEVAPSFFPRSPFLAVENEGKPIETGRGHANVNWACGRCHVGTRPTFAAGMATWNSVEYTDAMLGSCYTQLRCVDCHNPHRAIGPTWRASPDQDDAVCMKCHEQLRGAAQRQAHTHHAEGSEGSRCMNCHMPRINEGLQEVVRTHMIYTPTRADMIEANHPNACNLCHTDRTIDWTIDYLKQWYRKTYDDDRIALHYADRKEPAALGWLKSDNAAVRLVAADALARARDMRTLPQLLKALDDSHLINRQFASMGVERMLGVRLADSGYQFFHTKEERRKSLSQIVLRHSASR